VPTQNTNAERRFMQMSKTLLLLLSVTLFLAGCGGGGEPGDRNIKATREITYPGGGVETPIGGADYDHGGTKDEYEGPVDGAPDWARPSKDSAPK